MDLRPDDIRKIMDEVIDRFVIPIFEEEDMNASGEWLKNIHGDATDTSGLIVGRDYSVYLDEGRPPSEKYPPIDQLERWVKIKLGLSGNQATSAAWAIATKIKNEGTEYYKRGGTDLIKVLLRKEVIDFVQKEIGNLIKVRALEEIRELW